MMNVKKAFLEFAAICLDYYEDDRVRVTKYGVYFFNMDDRSLADYPDVSFLTNGVIHLERGIKIPSRILKAFSNYVDIVDIAESNILDK